MVDNLLDEFDGRLLRITIAYPVLGPEIQKIKKHTSYALNNDRDPQGKPLDKRRTLRKTIKRVLVMVSKHPELKEFVKPIIKKAVNYLEPQHASTNKH
jgi:hypothetical protein